MTFVLILLVNSKDDFWRVSDILTFLNTEIAVKNASVLLDIQQIDLKVKAIKIDTRAIQLRQNQLMRQRKHAHSAI